MKLKKIYTILFVSFALTGCDFLDFDESSGMDKEEAYAYFDNVTRMVSGVYRAVPSDWGKISDALRESATDNAVYTWTNNAGVENLFQCLEPYQLGRRPLGRVLSGDS